MSRWQHLLKISPRLHISLFTTVDRSVETQCPLHARLTHGSSQVCVAIKRVYIHSSIYKDFVAAMVRHVKSMVVGDGMDGASGLGPVQNAMQYQKLKDMVATIKSDNLKVSAGDLQDTFSDKKGYFMNPIVVDNPPDDSDIVAEEPFGTSLHALSFPSPRQLTFAQGPSSP